MAEHNIIVTRFVLMVEGRPDVEMALPQGGDEPIPTTVIMKEGTEFRLKLCFRVNNNIVQGLRYHQTMSRKDIHVDKLSEMVGSYGPKEEEQSYIMEAQEAPKGIIARGHYTVDSKLVDDDKNCLFNFQWNMDIPKNWD